MKSIYGLLLTLTVSVPVIAQSLPPVFSAAETANSFTSHRVRTYFAAKRIVWSSDSSSQYISGVDNLLRRATGQAELTQRNLCVLKSSSHAQTGIILDFGREIQGGLQLVIGMMKSHDPVRIRIRLGESVSEVLNDIDSVKGATNDHAMRDFTISLPWLGTQEVGNSGLRFARLDLVDPKVELILKEVNAIFEYHNLS